MKPSSMSTASVLAVVLGAAGLLAACAASTTAAPSAAASAAGEAPWVAQARKAGQEAPAKLLAVLQDELARGGPEGAVAACRDQAPEIAREVSAQTGWAIRRVSLRNRNPKAVPDAWERAALEDFERRAAAGEAPGRLERAEVVVEGGAKVERWMRALPTAELCLNCHGTSDRIAPATAARIAALYPQDRATGYRVGEIRGAITLKRPAP